MLQRTIGWSAPSQCMLKFHGTKIIARIRRIAAAEIEIVLGRLRAATKTFDLPIICQSGARKIEL